MMIHKTLLLALATTSFVLGATPPKKDKVWVTSGEVLNTQHVCWFDEQRFSEGATKEMGNTIKVCALKFPTQVNGPLIWLPTDDTGRPIYPKEQSKISVR